ncbi:MAG: NAD-dependent epimerase/dehydratase family protein [Carbonactinosporaceae bacterium]
MRVFLAGATGAVGRILLPALVNAGHDVVGTTRSAAKADDVRAAGGEPVVLDALDADAVHAAVTAAKPEVVIHQLTDLTRLKSPKRFDAEFATTNRLRTGGLDLLLGAAQAAGARRFIAQSYTGWPNERSGGSVKTEDDPLDPNPAGSSRQSLAAIRHLEAAVTGAAGIEGLALRYGSFYGPGTSLGAGGDILRMVGKRQLPIVGGGRGVWSFVHIGDVAAATVAALDGGAPGLYNITDDEPAPVADWLPELADAIGAKPPRRVPAWLVRPMLGDHGISVMTQIRGSSNAKAKRELSWALAYPSWRQGFRTGLGPR